MKKVMSENCRIPVKMWLDDAETGALEQARNLANLPFAFRHIALMPDCHSGYGMPIGGVLATRGVVVPNAVGVDIGCGMCAVKTSMEAIPVAKLKELIHRKGATSARLGETGIIPGSQGTSSYIVQGKGNPESFQSCSHGAGRIMGRKQAMRVLDLKEEIKRLDRQGIVHSIRAVKDLDEAPGAYKNIDVVMENQRDLVDILVKLEPLAVIKG